MTLESPEDLRKRMAKESQPEEAEKDFSKPYHSFDFDRTVRGQQFKGTFISKVPSIGDQIEIGRLKSVYLPHGATADQNAAALVEAVCYLEVTLDAKRPEWWKPMEFLDSAIVMMVYAEVVAYANKFLGVNKGSGTTSKTDEGSGESGGEAALDKSGVVEDVQTPPERREVVITKPK